MNNSMATDQAPLTLDEKRGIQAAEFAWDLVLQLAALREQRELSQAKLAEIIGTKQQAISRMEDPLYASHTLRILRLVAEGLHAFLDVTLVPEEKLPEYLHCRYRPVLDPTPAGCQVPASEFAPWRVVETEVSDIVSGPSRTLHVQTVEVKAEEGNGQNGFTASAA